MSQPANEVEALLELLGVLSEPKTEATLDEEAFVYYKIAEELYKVYSEIDNFKVLMEIYVENLRIVSTKRHLNEILVSLAFTAHIPKAIANTYREEPFPVWRSAFLGCLADSLKAALVRCFGPDYMTRVNRRKDSHPAG